MPDSPSAPAASSPPSATTAPGARKESATAARIRERRARAAEQLKADAAANLAARKPGDPPAPFVPRLPNRPRNIPTPAEFDQLVDEYLAVCRETPGAVLTRAGLCLHLGFYAKEQLDDYARLPGFAASVKRARVLIEAEYERRLDGSKGMIGAIFALKNVAGWKDQTATEFRGVLAHIDYGRLTDAQVARIAAGEPVLAVLSSSPLALPAGPSVQDAPRRAIVVETEAVGAVVTTPESGGPQRGA